MEEYEFLQVCAGMSFAGMSLFGKSVKQRLEQALKLRNGAGHPNQLAVEGAAYFAACDSSLFEAVEDVTSARRKCPRAGRRECNDLPGRLTYRMEYAFFIPFRCASVRCGVYAFRGACRCSATSCQRFFFHVRCSPADRAASVTLIVDVFFVRARFF